MNCPRDGKLLVTVDIGQDDDGRIGVVTYRCEHCGYTEHGSAAGWSRADIRRRIAAVRQTMKALTVQPPWSHAIAWLGKDVERRSRPTRFRGELAVHAGKSWSFGGGTDPQLRRAWAEWAEHTGMPHAELNRYSRTVERNAVVAVVDLVDCHEDVGCCKPWGFSDLAQPMRWHWKLANVRRPDRPVRCLGAQGLLWTLPPELAAQVRAGLQDPVVS